ncbi:hypothetical protein [Hyphomonas sp.]|uniref:hypothetical protein n=1 Tax=Hyphomonas sp. TaxID=87 RepID=UPI003F71A81C
MMTVHFAKFTAGAVSALGLMMVMQLSATAQEATEAETIAWLTEKIPAASHNCRTDMNWKKASGAIYETTIVRSTYQLAPDEVDGLYRLTRSYSEDTTIIENGAKLHRDLRSGFSFSPEHINSVSVGELFSIGNPVKSTRELPDGRIQETIGNCYSVTVKFSVDQQFSWDDGSLVDQNFTHIAIRDRNSAERIRRAFEHWATLARSSDDEPF